MLYRHSLQTVAGINRNIVECKYRYMVQTVGGCGIVLIETLWNVNSGRKDTIETAVAY